MKVLIIVILLLGGCYILPSNEEIVKTKIFCDKNGMDIYIGSGSIMCVPKTKCECDCK